MLLCMLWFGMKYNAFDRITSLPVATRTRFLVKKLIK